LPHLWKSAAVSGLLAVALGIAIVAWPAISIVIAAIFFGACLLVNGIQQVFFAFSLHVSAGGRVLLFISGAASLILAIMAFRHLGDAVLLLAIWIGVGFIFRGRLRWCRPSATRRFPAAGGTPSSASSA
jgi:uncharacterized membrane protein HdeD (DUF308 family)